MDNVYFSIIIPVYNSEKFLRECINSVLNQSFKSFEVILVDDGSTDNSPRICDEYENLYKDKIKVIHKRNEGQLATRLKGLEIAKGEYIYYVDADDTINSCLLKDVYEKIEIYNCDMVLFNFNLIDENNIFELHKPIFDYGTIQKDILIEQLVKSDELNSMCFKIFRKSLYKANIDYSKYYNIKNAEDLIQGIDLLFNANTFYYIDKPYYNYRINNNSVTYSFNTDELNFPTSILI